jgi:glycosyltransferase involved in cell wall biosynthesis
MSKSKVFIGLPVFNAQKHIRAAIESHLSQSFSDFELVIADNCSTDATLEISTEYASRDKRVRVLTAERNRGNRWNHRRLIEEISEPNQYFRWAGGDDVMGPDLLQSMVEVLDSRAEVSAVMPDTRNIDDEGNPIGSMPRTLDLQSPDVFKRAHDILTVGFQHVIAYGLIRVSVLRDMRTRPAYPHWDPVFAFELALRGQVVQTQGTHLLRRFHPGSISLVKKVSEVRRWAEPEAKAGMIFPTWKIAYERARVLMACPMSLRDRMRIALFLARVVSWQRKELTHDVVQAGRRALRLSDEYTF